LSINAIDEQYCRYDIDERAIKRGEFRRLESDLAGRGSASQARKVNAESPG
jgi:hypothetical protein